MLIVLVMILFSFEIPLSNYLYSSHGIHRLYPSWTATERSSPSPSQTFCGCIAEYHTTDATEENCRNNSSSHREYRDRFRPYAGFWRTATLPHPNNPIPIQEMYRLQSESVIFRHQTNDLSSEAIPDMPDVFLPVLLTVHRTSSAMTDSCYAGFR